MTFRFWVFSLLPLNSVSEPQRLKMPFDFSAKPLPETEEGRGAEEEEAGEEESLLLNKDKNRRRMDPAIWHKVAAVSGMAALGLGTYGAHVFKPQNPAYKEVWQTASLYHLVHTAALASAPLARNPNVFGGLLTAGILAFSGTCYTVALLEDRTYAKAAPFGGFAFIAAWASLLF